MAEKRFLKDLVFGIICECALCKERAHLKNGICHRCLSLLKERRESICTICGESIAEPFLVCEECQRRLYNFDIQRSAGAYSGNLRAAIARMKYANERWLANPLGALLADVVMEFCPADFLIPIPITKGSLRKRGYNQASDLALEAGEFLDLPVLDILEREERQNQADLGREERLHNLKGSMAAKKDFDLGHKAVILVDDVSTTGATLDEGARVLRLLGAEKIYCATLAKTEKL